MEHLAELIFKEFYQKQNNGKTRHEDHFFQ